MEEFPISWRFTRNSSNDFKINTEWSLACLWSQRNTYKPEFIEIRRNTTVKETLVSGIFKLTFDEKFHFQRKFQQLIEVGFETTHIKFEYVYDSNYNSNYSIYGALKVTAYEPNTEYAKAAQLKCLLDLSDDFECLLDPKATYFSDVNINCGSVSFSAHKNILSARSDVFAAMFASQMKENQCNKVDITDLSPQITKTMLTYIYSGKTGELSVQSAGELLFAADKYQLRDLKRVCSDYLKSCVSTENILSTLVLGELHNRDLKVFAMDFICNSSKDFEVLEETVDWKNLREKRPSVAMNVLTCLVKFKDKKLKTYK